MASVEIDQDIPKIEKSTEAPKKISDVVAGHYNKLDEKGLEERTKSRIFYLRNFNNWVKSMLIGDYVERVKKQNESSKKKITVLDLCCGKGGDLLKWKIGGIDYLVCADIAETSVQQCEQRYKDMKHRSHSERRRHDAFEAEFITADCTKDVLKTKYKKKDIQFDLVSCQFSFHYCFESYAQVDRMLQNISECLRPGGFFIGTTPDANRIVNRIRQADGLKFGNEVYSITFPDKSDFPLFGSKYDFHLEGVVDCPEFLVYFPLLEKLAEKHKLKLVYRERFDKFYNETLKKEDGKKNQYESGRQLLGRMQALESYPPFDGSDLTSQNEADYSHAKEEVESLKEGSSNNARVGTLTKSEWEAICLYLVFVFEKQSEGKDDSSKEASVAAEKEKHKVEGEKEVLKRKHDEDPESEPARKCKPDDPEDGNDQEQSKDSEKSSEVGDEPGEQGADAPPAND